MKFLLNKILTLMMICFLVACDSEKEDNPIQAWAICEMLGQCFQENTRFGMIGDSWTDFAFGTSLQRDLHDFLVEEHGYKITAANIAGQTMSAEVHQFFAYRRVIEGAGSEIRHMLISLGGNDFLDNLEEYTTSNSQTVLNQRLIQYEKDFATLMFEANKFKLDLYGGKPLKWYIHGYDYGNPEKVTQCNFTNINSADRQVVLTGLLDSFNSYLQSMAQRYPNLNYIDLRQTLGGPPISNPDLKFDCIHPNEIGFQLIAKRYAHILQLYTQER